MIYIFCFFIISYFSFHILHGERGVYAQYKLEKDIGLLKADLASLKDQSLQVKQKSYSMGGGSGRVDQDLLMEHLRALGYAKKDELILMD